MATEPGRPQPLPHVCLPALTPRCEQHRELGEQGLQESFGTLGSPVLPQDTPRAAHSHSSSTGALQKQRVPERWRHSGASAAPGPDLLRRRRSLLAEGEAKQQAM